jgi:mannose-6-phosphate isomerase
MRRSYRLTPSLRPKVWGRKRLSPWFPDADEPIGEVWYEANCELPLLVKLLFTSERLSIQVHPDDGEDGPRGKTEMWHILEAEPGAQIALGFREPITRERMIEAAQTGEIERLVRWFPVHPGETYVTPAHTVHAIGAGIVLCEIQQNSDVTYRLYDYGRPRELHLAQAAAVADLGVHPGRTLDEEVRTKHFVTSLVEIKASDELRTECDECDLWIVLEGEGTIDGEPYRAGEVWQGGERIVVKADWSTRMLRTYAPFEEG